MEFDKTRFYTAVNAEELNPGDKVFLADTAKDLDEMIDEFDNDRVRTITSIIDNSFERRFIDEIGNAYALAYLVERKPADKYRPYKNIAEMVDDWKSRFSSNIPDYAMPLIWVKNKGTGDVCLITELPHTGSSVLLNCEYYHSDDLYDDYTYLDGSPCGKKCEVKE